MSCEVHGWRSWGAGGESRGGPPHHALHTLPAPLGLQSTKKKRMSDFKISQIKILQCLCKAMWLNYACSLGLRLPPYLDNSRDLCASWIYRLNSQIPSEANKSSSVRMWGEHGPSRAAMISPGLRCIIAAVSLTRRGCAAPPGSQPRAASGCVNVFRNTDLFLASKTRIIFLNLSFFALWD